MDFENHLFISYAHLDNTPPDEQQQGWVSKFHASLAAYVSQWLGREAKIWFDPKLTGNDVFGDEIVKQFPKTALLVSVVSPRYVQSAWCTKEANEFNETAETTGGVRVENKSRIFKVVLLPPDSYDPLPQIMKDSLGYEFYVIRQDEHMPRRLDSRFGKDFDEKYNLKVDTLAYDIAQLLKKMIQEGDSSASASPAAAAAQGPKPAVYLAECTYDCRDAREALASELKLHGYQVLPDKTLPADKDAYLLEVQKLLARCRLSVHLVGSQYGGGPNGQPDNFVILQNEAAIARCAQARLERVIWLPSSQSDSAPQQQFIESLRKDPRQQAGADLIEDDIEKLKGAVHAALRKIEAANEEDASKLRVYVAECSFDRRADRDALIQALQQHGYEVLPTCMLPVEEEKYGTEVQKLLAKCQVAVHLVGAKYGKVPDGPSDKSAVILQNELAIARSKEASLARLIWLPEETSATSPLEQQFIDSLRTDSGHRQGAELITGDIEALKSATLATLSRIEDVAAEAAAAAAKAAADAAAAKAASVTTAATSAAPAGTTSKLVYIICDRSDGRDPRPLRKFLNQRGIDSETPAFDDDPGAMRKAHESMLAQCDGVILYYGNGNKAWRLSMESDLKKLPAYRAGKPIPPIYTFVTGATTDDKEDLLDLGKATVLNGAGEISESMLAPLLKEFGS